MRIASLFAASILLMEAAAVAIVPASDEQLVCTPTSMFRGTVTKAKSGDCRLRLRRGEVDCAPHDFAEITVQVEDIMPGSQSPLKVGEARNFSTRFCNTKPIKIGKELIDICSLNESDPPIGRNGLVATNGDVARAFVGKSFYFTLWYSGPYVETWTKPSKALAIWTDVCPSSTYRRKFG